MKTAQTNIALIGAGMVADTHVAAIRASNAGLNLAGVLGRDPVRAQAFAGKYEVQAYPDLAALTADKTLDFAILATPPDARQEIVAQLIAARLPILMEKPVERDLPRAAALVTACEGAGLPMGILFQHRARAASVALKRVVETGTLGQIATVDIAVPWWRDPSYYDAPGRGTYARDGGGVMISQAIHTLDLALWLLGPITSVQAIMHRTPLHQLEAEDWAAALLTFDSGAVGSLRATTAAFPGTAEALTIQGTKAAAHLASGVLTLTHLDGRVETFGAAASTGGGADPMAFTHAWHQSVIEDFAQALREGRPPMATARSALQSHAVIDAMTRASISGRTADVTQ